MTRPQAYRQLKLSLADLRSRQGEATISDVEAEVINLACLEVFRRRRSQDFSAGKGLLDINIFAMREYAEQEVEYAEQVVTHFADAAQELYQSYDSSHATIASMQVQQNCAWEGMWEFLRKYFREKHEFDIEDIPEWDAEESEESDSIDLGKRDEIKSLAQSLLDERRSEYSLPEMSIIIQSQYYSIEELFTFGANLESDNPDEHIDVADTILRVCQAFFSNLEHVPDSIGWDGMDQQIERIKGIRTEVAASREVHLAMKEYKANPSLENRERIIRLMDR